MSRSPLLAICLAVILISPLAAQTWLPREPAVNAREIAFTYGADPWIVDKAGGEARRLTSTPAVESSPLC